MSFVCKPPASGPPPTPAVRSCQQRADYADHLQRHGLVLDEDGDERYAGRTAHAVLAPGFGDAFAG
ncbi:hypothetical protein [Streptomyces geranii]|uniref:hypothetical protein n=1 Tax=Streptomyces geranii TaxID=2058923 RepID=UPI000D02730E|nr:hypothetical protein [Streptomyces geranii]